MLKLNQSYGQRRILLEYAGREDQPVHAFLQHGWTLRADAGSGRYANSRWFRSAPRLYWSERQRHEAALSGIPYTVVTGAPFLYLMRTRQLPLFPEPRSPEGTRVLVYPRHSAEFTPYAAADEAVSAVSKAVASGRRVTVCLHPVDARRPDVIRRYLRVGASVTQHGYQLYDNDFLKRQLGCLSSHDVVWSYGLGSAALYASAVGIPVLFPSPDGAAHEVLPPPEEFGARKDVYMALVRQPSLTHFARLELGVDHLLTSNELSQILGVNGLRSWQARGLRAAGRLQARVRHRLLHDVTASG